jgi:prepilin-type N-terminal cleavage/methylation domain-containing protein
MKEDNQDLTPTPKLGVSLPSRRGFTLIELLVVIAIIGLLASVVLVSLNSARAKARDTKRKADLAQISKALELYYDKYGTYITIGGGWRSTPSNPATACGCGWLGYQDTGNYTLAVTAVLKNEGFLSQSLIDDPKGPNPSYMIYTCGGNDNGQRFSLYATLENPTAAEAAAVSTGCGVSVDTSYGKNYIVGN